MNRAERRQAMKLGIKGEMAPTKTVGQFIHLYTLSMMLALDSEGVDKDLAIQILKKIEENADCMISGHINQRDVETMCSDIYGIDFVEGRYKKPVYVNPDGTLTTGR